MNLKWKIICGIIVAFILWLLGFYLGRTNVKETIKIDTTYIKGDTIRDTILNKEIKPYKVIAPVDTANIIKQCIKDGAYADLFPNKVVTEYVEVTKEDTTAIMKDWASKRYYAQTLFDSDTLGTCKINAEVQYNRLDGINYEFVPVIKVITKKELRTKIFSPFVGVGGLINTNENKNFYGTISAGAFIKEKYGLQLQYQRDFKDKGNIVGGSFLFKL